MFVSIPHDRTATFLKALHGLRNKDTVGVGLQVSESPQSLYVRVELSSGFFKLDRLVPPEIPLSIWDLVDPTRSETLKPEYRGPTSALIGRLIRSGRFSSDVARKLSSFQKKARLSHRLTISFYDPSLWDGFRPMQHVWSAFSEDLRRPRERAAE